MYVPLLLVSHLVVLPAGEVLYYFLFLSKFWRGCTGKVIVQLSYTLYSILSLQSAIFIKNDKNSTFLWTIIGALTFVVGLITYYFQNKHGLACGFSFRSGFALGVFLWVYYLKEMFETGNWKGMVGWPDKLIIGDERNIFY